MSVLRLSVFKRFFYEKHTYVLLGHLEVSVLERCLSYGISVIRDFTVPNFSRLCPSPSFKNYKYTCYLLPNYVLVVNLTAPTAWKISGILQKNSKGVDHREGGCARKEEKFQSGAKLWLKVTNPYQIMKDLPWVEIKAFYIVSKSISIQKLFHFESCYFGSLLKKTNKIFNLRYFTPKLISTFNFCPD